MSTNLERILPSCVAMSLVFLPKFTAKFIVVKIKNNCRIWEIISFYPSRLWKNLTLYIFLISGPGSSVCIATSYGLDGPGIEKRLRWFRGLHPGLWYPRSRVRSRPKPSDFSWWKIHSMQYDTIQTTIESPIPGQLSTKYGKKKIPVGARFFTHVQTGPGAHPISCTMGTGSFLGVKRPGRGAEHPTPS
jgi:hypothetical protein